MRIGCSSWSFHRTIEKGELDLLGFIKKCGTELKLDGVELLEPHFSLTDLSYMRAIKRLVVDYGLDIVCLSVKNDFSSKERDQLTKNFDNVCKWIDIAQFLGAPLVRVFGIRNLADSSLNSRNLAQWDNAIHYLKKSTDYAKQRGIILGLENHRETAEEIMSMIDKVGSDWFRLTLDTGNFKKNIYDSIAQTVPLAVIVHAKCYRFDQKGVEQVLNYEKIMDILVHAEFSGYLSIEYEGQGDELLDVPKAVRYLKKLNSDFRQ